MSMDRYQMQERKLLILEKSQMQSKKKRETRSKL